MLPPDVAHAKRKCFTSEIYLNAARMLATATPDDCHPGLYRVRDRMVNALREYAGNPSAEAHCATLVAVRMFCYPLRTDFG